jgi:hypothetical protein
LLGLLYVKIKNGGLGVMNLEIMNKALLAKWMVRYKDVMFMDIEKIF